MPRNAKDGQQPILERGRKDSTLESSRTVREWFSVVSSYRVCGTLLQQTQETESPQPGALFLPLVKEEHSFKDKNFYKRIKVWAHCSIRFAFLKMTSLEGDEGE